MEKPLVSFCIKCYNQEKLIVPALEGAFAQSYRPLEIVISDDCSTDQTVAVVRRMVEAYRTKGGDIPVTVLTNERNLGSLGNWQRICESARGELFVKADGDDISLPERTEEVVRAWLAAGKPLVVYHEALKMDFSGRVFCRFRRAVLDNGPYGAMCAYSRRLVDAFGGVCRTNRTAYDDCVYGQRMRILGGEPLFVAKSMVKFRVGSGVSSGLRKYRKFMSSNARGGIGSCDQLALDVESCKVSLSDEARATWRETLRTRKAHLQAYLRLLQGGTFAERRAACRELAPTTRGLSQNLIHRLLVLGAAADPILDALQFVKYWVDRLRFKMEGRKG